MPAKIQAGALKNGTWPKGTVIYSSDDTKILRNRYSYAKGYDSWTGFNIPTVHNSRGHIRFSNKQPLMASVHFFEKSKYYSYILTFLQKLVVWEK